MATARDGRFTVQPSRMADGEAPAYRPDSRASSTIGDVPELCACDEPFRSVVHLARLRFVVWCPTHGGPFVLTQDQYEREVKRRRAPQVNLCARCRDEPVIDDDYLCERCAAVLSADA